MLTDTEACVLFYLKVLGPSTSYALTRRLIESPAHWLGGGASTVYATVKRLSGRGLLTSQALPGRRLSTAWSLSSKGRQAFLEWLETPLSATEYRHCRPAFEMKCANLMVLSPPKRMVFLARQIELLEEYRRVFGEFVRRVGKHGLSEPPLRVSLDQIARDLAMLYELRGRTTPGTD